MKDLRTQLLLFSVFTVLGLTFSACEDGLTLNCFPKTYRCGGDEQNLVQYCDSSGRRWQTFQDCTELGETCVDGRCVETDLDGDGEQEEDESPQACHHDADCDAGSFCVDEACVEALGQRHDLTTQTARLVYNNQTGRVDLYAGKEPAMSGLHAQATFRCGSEDTWQTLATDDAFLAARTVEIRNENDALGKASRLRVLSPDLESPLRLQWTLSAYEGQDLFTASLRLQNQGDETCEVRSFSTLALSDAEDVETMVRLSGSTGGQWVLQSGSYLVQDTPRLLPADMETDPDAPASWLDEPWDAPFVSNQGQLLLDPAARTAQLVAFLRSEKGYNLIHFGKGESTTATDGVPAYGLFRAESLPGFTPRRLEPMEPLDGDPLMIVPKADDPLALLERHAVAFALMNDVAAVEDRRYAATIPATWNASTVDTETMESTLAFLQEHLLAWGLTRIGVVRDAGSLSTDEVLAAALSAIKQAEFKADVSDAPMTLPVDDPLWTAHPDWKGTVHPSFAGLLPQDTAVLDVTVSEARAQAVQRLESLLSLPVESITLTGIDASAFVLGQDEAEEPAPAALAKTLTDFRTLASETVLGYAGRADLPLGHVDRRIPLGYDLTSLSDTEQGQGWRSFIRDTARRIAFQGRAGRMLPAEFPMRPMDTTLDRVQLQTLATWQFLVGAPVLLSGEPSRWDAPQVSLLRKVLFTHPVAARPLDLFDKDIPELWHLRVVVPNGTAEPYDLLGLFHFGENTRLATGETLPADQARSVTLDLRELGLAARTDYHLFDFWDDTYLGTIRDSLSAEVPAYGVKLFALRPVRNTPRFVGWNRHAGVGTHPLRSEVWDEASQTLTLLVDVAPDSSRYPFAHSVSIATVASLEFVELVADEAFGAVSVEASDGLLRLRFTPIRTAEKASLVLRFTKAGTSGR